MGYRVGRVYVLEFVGTGMEGAVIKVASPSIDTIEAIPDMKDEQLHKTFFEHLREWNLEARDGSSLHMTVHAARAEMEPEELKLIVREWYRAARGVTAPLDTRVAKTSSTPSNAGAPSPEMESLELSMPMETS